MKSVLRHSVCMCSSLRVWYTDRLKETFTKFYSVTKWGGKKGVGSFLYEPSFFNFGFTGAGREVFTTSEISRITWYIILKGMMRNLCVPRQLKLWPLEWLYKDRKEIALLRLNCVVILNSKFLSSNILRYSYFNKC